MKCGTVIKMGDGRVGTVTYNGLDGVGVVWGRHDITPADIRGNGGLFEEEVPRDYPWCPEAMLRKPYPGQDLPCVGEDYDIVHIPVDTND